MATFLRLMAAEWVKWRRSRSSSLVWMLPLLFVGLEFLVFERPALGFKQFPPGFQAMLEDLQTRMVVSLWGGFFQPLALALVPALLFRPEHRFKTWRHLHALPVPRRQIDQFHSFVIVDVFLPDIARYYLFSCKQPLTGGPI